MEKTTTIWAERLVPAREADTRWRMSSSARAVAARPPRSWRRPGPRSREFIMSAAIMRSAVGSSRSSANWRSAWGSGTRTRMRSASRARSERMTGEAA